MPLPMVHWLSRPLARFLRRTWMSHTLLSPAGLDGVAAFLFPRKKTPPKPDARISLEMLEQRCTPQDMLGVLKSGISVAGFALMSGQFITPLHALFQGWDDGFTKAQFANNVSSASVTPPPVDPQPAPGQMEALASLGTAHAPDQGGAAGSVPVQPASQVQPAGQTSQSDFALGDWLQSVGDFLGNQAPHAAMPAGAGFSGSTSGGGGGGGGGSSAPGSGLSTSLPAEPMSTTSANVPNADTAAEMTQPRVAVPSGAVSSAGGGAQSVPVQVVSGGKTQTTVAPVTSTQTPTTPTQPATPQSTVAHPSLQTDYEQTPLPFELNVGQTDPSVLALSHGAGFGFWLTDSSMVFSVPHHDAQTGEQTGSDVFTLQMVGGSSQPEIVTGTQLPSWSNYFIGSDSSQWLPDVAQYSSLTYQDVYPGINLALQSNSLGSRDFEYDFVLQPGATMSEIQLNAQGVQSLAVDGQGRLVLGTSGGDVYMDAPVFYQTVDGQKQNVAGSYVLGPNDTIGFAVTGSYDTSQPLVLDPTINFATYLGGSGDDEGYAIAVDQNGNSYITGSTTSTDFPIVDGYSANFAGDSDIFVTKMTAGGGQIAYSTYLGGSTGATGGGGGGGFGGIGSETTPNQAGLAIAVDAAGEAVVAGDTSTVDFPTTAGAYNTTGGSTVQTVVFQLNATGDALEFSTFLGSMDIPDGVAVDTTGVYVSGTVSSSGSIPATGGAYQTSFGSGTSDAWVAKLDGGGDSLIYATYLGGSGDQGYNTDLSLTSHDGLAIDSSGDVYVTGQTTSSDFPTTAGAYQTTLAGTTDAFVSEVSPDGSSLIYSTYVGATGDSEGYGIAVDVTGQAFVTGATDSTSFPTAGGAFQTSNAGDSDAFALCLDPTGSTFVYATYLGGSFYDYGYSIAVDSNDQATVVGTTYSSDFPTTTGAFLTMTYGVEAYAFVTRLTATGTLSYSSLIGSTSSLDLSGTTEGYGVALDPRGDAYVTGATTSTSLIGSGGGEQSGNAGGSDVFALEVLPDRPVAPIITDISPDTGGAGSGITSAQNLTVEGTGPANTTLTLELDGVGVLSDSVPVSAGGTWSYDYTGTTLPAGNYDFQAVVNDSTGAVSDPSNNLPVTVAPNGPTVTLSVPAVTSTLTPEVTVTVSDPAGIPSNAVVTLSYEPTGTTTYSVAGTVTVNAGGSSSNTTATGTGTATISGSGTLTGTGTGNGNTTGTSNPVSTTVTTTSYGTWPVTATFLTADPTEGDAAMQLGDASTSIPLDLDLSGGSQSGGAALVYNSSEANATPIVQVQVPTPSSPSLPSTFSAQLTVGTVVAATVTYSTAGDSGGETLDLALQAGAAMATGQYNYTVTVQQGSGGPTDTFTGSVIVLSETSSALGAGWTLGGTDQLVSLAADTYSSAGMLMIYGSGSYRFFAGTSSFTSPPGDNGTLTLTGGTYTYETPDGTTETFNSAGLETKWTSADGLTSMLYSYDGSHRLTGITAIDGTVTTISYSGSTSVAIETVNGRTTTLTLSGGNLVNVENPDRSMVTMTYDGDGHLLSYNLGMLQDEWSYSSAGVLNTYTWGSSTSPSKTTYLPAVTDGYSTPWVGTVTAGSIDPDGNLTTEVLDSQGRLLMQTLANGETTTMTYSNGFLTGETNLISQVGTYSYYSTTTYSLDGDGYVILETLPNGGTIGYDYDESVGTGHYHSLLSMTNELGGTTTYAYDSLGHLTSMTDPLGDVTTWTYYPTTGLVENVTEFVDGLTDITTYVYDSMRLSVVTDPLGDKTTYNYDANGYVSTVTEALGQVTTYNYDVMGRLDSIVQAPSIGGSVTYTTTYDYDVSGLETTTTDAAGTETSIVYDSFGRGLVSAVYDGVGSTLVTSTLYTYDPDGNVSTTRDAIGAVTTYSYDQVGNVVKTINALGDITSYNYDLAGDLTSTTDPMGMTTTYAYDASGWVTTMTQPQNTVTTYNYDAAGDLTSEVDPVVGTTAYAYNALGELTTVTDPMGYTTTTTYDPEGDVSTVTDPKGTTTSYSYDGDGDLTKTTMLVGSTVLQTMTEAYDAVGDVTASTDGNGNTTTYAYDALGDMTSETDPLGNVTTYAYDAVGDVTKVTDALGGVTTYLYDSLHRQTGTIDPLGHQTTITLNGDGYIAATTDALNRTTTYSLDALGQTTATIDALGNVTTTTYYPNGDPDQVIDPDNNTTTYYENTLEQVTQITTPLGTTTMDYDAAGRLTSETDADGRVDTYTYDADSDLTGETWKSSAGATLAANVFTYTYDHDNNLLTASNNAGTETYAYDALDRVTSYTNVFGQVLTYSYDNDNNVTLRTDSLGGTLTSVYDGNSDLTSLQFSGTGATGTVVRVDFGYDKLGEQTTVTWYSNLAGTSVVVDSAYNYDAAGEVTAITNKNSAGTTLSYYDYSYNASGLMAQQVVKSTVGTLVYSGTANYSYYANDELKTDPTGTFTYDKAGNRNMSGYTTGTDNEVTNDGTYTYTYDAVGNLTTKTSGSGAGRVTWTYSYDNANELIGVVETNHTGTVTQITYTYDAEGDRVQEQVWTSSAVTTTCYAIDPVDGDIVWAELDGNLNPLVRYEYGAGGSQILTRTIVSGTLAGVWAYLTDAQGSIRDVVNWSGQIKDHLDYGVWGGITESNPSYGDSFKYDGYQYDTATGLYYDHARWYNDVTGTWLTQDPIGFAGGQANLSQYVGNDPTNLTDPSGLKGKWKNPFSLENEDYGSYSNGGFASGNMFATTPNNGSYKGPDPIEQIEQQLSSGKPLYMGSGKFYGNGNQNMAEAGYDAGKLIQDAAIWEMGFLSLMPGAGGSLAFGVGVGMKLTAGNWQGAGIDILLPLGIGGLIKLGRWGLGKLGKLFKLSCFPAGTPVHTSVGLKAIEQIKVGDRVWAYDHRELRWTQRDVLEVYDLLHQGPMATLQVKGETIRTTGGHPFWVVRGEGLAERPLPGHIAPYVQDGRLEGRWVLAVHLRAGDEVLLRDCDVVPLESVQVDMVKETVYNFNVAELENYAVGGWGALVHNTNMPMRGNPELSALIKNVAEQNLTQAEKVALLESGAAKIKGIKFERVPGVGAKGEVFFIGTPLPSGKNMGRTPVLGVLEGGTVVEGLTVPHPFGKPYDVIVPSNLKPKIP